MKPVPEDSELEAAQVEFKPLTPEEAQALRQRQPRLSAWALVAAQALAAVLVTLAVWAFTGQARMARSAGWGALAVVGPAALFARGITRRHAAFASFMGWEIVKVALAVAMLVMAPRVVAGLSWPALLVGMLVAMKSVWIVLWLRPSRPRCLAQRNLSSEELQGTD